MICWSWVRDSLLPHSNILRQDMNLVGAPQCCLSRGWQCVAPEVDLRKCTLHSPLAMRIRQDPLWPWNPEEMSPEIQNRGTSSPKIGHVNVSDKKTFWKKISASSSLLSVKGGRDHAIWRSTVSIMFGSPNKKSRTYDTSDIYLSLLGVPPRGSPPECCLL